MGRNVFQQERDELACVQSDLGKDVRQGRGSLEQEEGKVRAERGLPFNSAS